MYAHFSFVDAISEVRSFQASSRQTDIDPRRWRGKNTPSRSDRQRAPRCTVTAGECEECRSVNSLWGRHGQDGCGGESNERGVVNLAPSDNGGQQGDGFSRQQGDGFSCQEGGGFSAQQESETLRDSRRLQPPPGGDGGAGEGGSHTAKDAPKYVVRPIPPPPPQEHVVMESGRYHCLDRSVWMKVFSNLSLIDLSHCLRVCKAWNRWTIHPSFWRRVDLSGAAVKHTHLRWVVLRQPKAIDMSRCFVSQRQLLWLLARLPHLKSLTLSSHPWATICALCSHSTPNLRALVLSWAVGLRSECFRELLEQPCSGPILRPGMDTHLPRLRLLHHLDLTGTEVDDSCLELISVHLVFLQSLELSACMRLTDTGVGSLTTPGRPLVRSLSALSLYRCLSLTDKCLEVLVSLQNLRRLDLSRIPGITVSAYRWFQDHYTWRCLQMTTQAIFTYPEPCPPAVTGHQAPSA